MKQGFWLTLFWIIIKKSTLSTAPILYLIMLDGVDTRSSEHL
jgi:hypothetical protein